MKQCVRHFDSRSEEYDEIFKFCMDHTDEKQKSIVRLKEVVNKLPFRRQFIDAGAGNGILTQPLTPYFAHTTALEPNRELRRQLQQNCPGISIQPDFIMDAELSIHADFILCSHVLYYIEQTQWLAHIEKLATWLAPDGILVLMLQHHESDCMHMQAHFFQRAFNLATVAQTFKEQKREEYQVDVEIMPLDIVVPDLFSACCIAEFMLNLLPVANMPTLHEVESHIEQYFQPQDQVYRFSSDQTIVRIHQQKGKLSCRNNNLME